MIDRLRSERGMTLTEVLVTLVISMALSLATFSLVDVTLRRTGEITARADGVQRGRVAMDLMTRQLRSQVCLGASAPVSRSIVAGSASSVTFYAELGDPSTLGAGASPSATPRPRIVEKRSLTLETAGRYAPGTLVERRYVGVPTPSHPLGYVFPDVPTSTRELMRPIALAKTPNQPTATPALFRFYGWDTSNAADPKPTVLLPFATANALSDADVKRVARIEVTFRAKPLKSGKASTVFFNEVTLRTVDPNAPTGELNIPCL
jgi:prepilin-type N-terminal cleavage/methylation domain-containing protein